MGRIESQFSQQELEDVKEEQVDTIAPRLHRQFSVTPEAEPAALPTPSIQTSSRIDKQFDAIGSTNLNTTVPDIIDPINDDNLPDISEFNEGFIRINPIPSTQITTNPIADLGNMLVGGGELVASMATDLVGASIGGLIGISKELLAAIDSDDEASLRDFVEGTDMVRDLFRYNPRTIEGKAVTQFVGDVFHAMLVEPGRKAGHFVLEHTGSVPLAAAIATVPEAIFILLPFLISRGKGSNLASETGNALKEKYIKGEEVNVFSDATMVQLEAANARMKQIRNKPKAELTSVDISEFNNLKAITEVINKKLAKVQGKDFVIMKKTDDVIRSLKAIDKVQIDSIKVAEIIKTARTNKGKPSVIVPVEIIVDGTNTIITKGAEAAIAAKVLGEAKIPVNIIVPKPNVKNTKAQADKAFAVQQKSKALDERVQKESTLSAKEKLTDTFDLTKKFTDRIYTSLPKVAADSIFITFKQMENAGSSAAHFARIRFDPIFKAIDRNNIVYERVLNDVKIPVTEIDIVNQIVRARVIKQISKRRPKYKTQEGLNAEHYSSELLQMKKDLGPELFDKFNTHAEKIFDVHKDLLELKLREGIIDQTLYNKLIEFDYSPQQHIKLMEINSELNLGVDSGVLRLKDGAGDLLNMNADQLLQHSISSTFNSLAINRVIKSLSDAVLENPNSGLASHITNLKTSRHKAPQGTTKVLYRRDGKEAAIAVDAFIRRVWVTPKDIAMARGKHDAIRLLSGVTTVRMGAVALEPAFILSELPRNFTNIGYSNGVSLSGKPLFGGTNYASHGIAGMPLAAGQLAKNMGMVLIEASKVGGIFNTTHFKRGVENNSIPQFIAEIGLEEYRSVTKRFNQESKAVKTMNKVANALAWLGIRNEALTRAAVIMQGDLKGLSHAEQSFESLRLVNYNDIGTVTGLLDHISPFASARFNAFRAQLRGFIEAPVRSGLYHASVMSTAMALYAWNWKTNPGAVMSMTDEDLGTKWMIALPPQFSYIDADGKLKHRMIPIAADGMAVPAIAIAGYMMRRWNEPGRKADDMIQNSIFKSTIPTFGTSSFPFMSAALSIFGNYDSFKNAPVFPRDVGSTYQEYYAEHERNNTPQIYVEFGKWLHETGLVNDGALEGFKSPERLRKAFNSYVPNHTITQAFNMMDTLVNPDTFELLNENRHMLDNAPFLGKVIKDASPGINLRADMDTGTQEQSIVNEDARKKVDKLTMLVAHNKLDVDTALANIDSMPITPENKSRLKIGLYIDNEVNKIYGRLSIASREGIPPIQWWGHLGRVTGGKDRARFYIDRIKATAPNKRAVMEQIKRRLSVTSKRFPIITSEFYREESRLRHSEDMEFKPGIFHYGTADANIPTLEDIVE